MFSAKQLLTPSLLIILTERCVFEHSVHEVHKITTVHKLGICSKAVYLKRPDWFQWSLALVICTKLCQVIFCFFHVGHELQLEYWFSQICFCLNNMYIHTVHSPTDAHLLKLW